MAKAISPLFNVLSGKLGSMVFLRNRHKQIIIRDHVVPADPATALQLEVRAAWSWAVALWISTTQANRDGWQEYASSVQYCNAFGAVHPTGRTAFLANISAAKWLKTRGRYPNNITAIPPIIPGLICIDDFRLMSHTGGGSGFNISFHSANPELIMIYSRLGHPVNATVNFYAGPFPDPAHTSEYPKNLVQNDTLERAYSFLTTNKIYFVKIRAISFQPPVRLSSFTIIRAVALA